MHVFITMSTPIPFIIFYIANIQNSDLPNCLSIHTVANMKSKFYRNTACGHNDFCSVRLNGPA